MKVISIINQKGGIGKTTTAQHLAIGLQKQGFKVLAIDMDQQGNLSLALNSKSDKSIYDFMTIDNFKTQIEKNENCDLIPSSPSLNTLQLQLAKQKNAYNILSDRVKTLKYDYVIIDTAPSITFLTANALICSNMVIIPTATTYYSLYDISQLVKTIESAKKINTSLEVKGILLTSCKEGSKLNSSVANVLNHYCKQLNTKVFNSRIRKSAKVNTAQMKKTNLFDYAPSSDITNDYKKLINEILEKEIFKIEE